MKRLQGDIIQIKNCFEEEFQYELKENEYLCKLEKISGDEIAYFANDVKKYVKVFDSDCNGRCQSFEDDATYFDKTGKKIEYKTLEACDIDAKIRLGKNIEININHDQLEVYKEKRAAERQKHVMELVEHPEQASGYLGLDPEIEAEVAAYRAMKDKQLKIGSSGLMEESNDQ